MTFSTLRSAALAATLALGLALAPGAAAQGSCALGTAEAVLDGNNVSARLYNIGGLFWRGGAAQYEVPKGSGLQSIFAAGLWLGGTVDGDLRAAAADYADWEFWPGPLTDGAPPADCSAFDRIYLVSRDDIEAYETTGTATPDLTDWPADLGAPVEDGDGNPDNYDLAAGDRPDLQEAAQTAWWVMNDAGNVHATTGTQPIGMEVRVQAFAFTPDGDEVPDFVDESTFYEYTLVYQGTDTFEAAYATLWVDGDLGNFEDDYVGASADNRLGFTYNADDDDEGPGGYGVDPPAVGVYGILAGPADEVRAGSSDFFRSSGFLPSPVSSVMYYNNVQNDPRGNPDTGVDFYNFQRARWRDGTRLVLGGDGYDPDTGLPTAYAFSGLPPTFWSEVDTQPEAGDQSNAPGDRRFLQTFGPFTFEPGDEVVIRAGILWARTDAGGGALGSLYELIDAAELINDGGADAPEPIFGNTLAPLTVSVPSNQTAQLGFSLANPGGADLSYSLSPGAGPGSAFLGLDGAEETLPAETTADLFFIDVDPDGAAVGSYQGQIVVASNDRNVVSAAIPVTVFVTPPVAGEDEATGVFALRAPVPNPAARASRIDFQTATAGPVHLAVVDLLGREVAVVVDETRPAGAYQASLPLATLPAGTYVVRLRAGADEATQRLTVVR